MLSACSLICLFNKPFLSSDLFASLNLHVCLQIDLAIVSKPTDGRDVAERIRLHNRRLFVMSSFQWLPCGYRVSAGAGRPGVSIL